MTAISSLYQTILCNRSRFIFVPPMYADARETNDSVHDRQRMSFDRVSINAAPVGALPPVAPTSLSQRLRSIFNSVDAGARGFMESNRLLSALCEATGEAASTIEPRLRGWMNTYRTQGHPIGAFITFTDFTDAFLHVSETAATAPSMQRSEDFDGAATAQAATLPRSVAAPPSAGVWEVPPPEPIVSQPAPVASFAVDSATNSTVPTRGSARKTSEYYGSVVAATGNTPSLLPRAAVGREQDPRFVSAMKTQLWLREQAAQYTGRRKDSLPSPHVSLRLAVEGTETAMQGEQQSTATPPLAPQPTASAAVSVTKKAEPTGLS
ncbi:MAG: hypothetical protein EOO65_02980, partial [Methanosarcinales archaeon]